MKEEGENWLLLAALASFLAGVVHILAMLAGAEWFRALGAGEQMAVMVEQGKIYPYIVTCIITGVLFCWGLYALSGAKYIIKLPFLRTCLVLITAVYCIRGVYGFFVPVFVDNPYVRNLGVGFWVGSSALCLAIGVVHILGVRRAWNRLSV